MLSRQLDLGHLNDDPLDHPSAGDRSEWYQTRQDLLGPHREGEARHEPRERDCQEDGGERCSEIR
jgi:hypothetical protein